MSANRQLRRVGILFSGGPAPAANAVISACTMNFLNAGIEVLGFYEGYNYLENWAAGSPLQRDRHYLRFTIDDVSGIRNERAIILRTSRANPGKAVKTMADLADPAKNGKLLAVHGALAELGVDGLISIGGDDTLKTANFIYKLQEVLPRLRPVSVVHLPKTIDNDYYGIDWTFGFNSAADFAAREIRNILADAKSTNSWWVLEIMGRKAGWLTYAAGVAGEAHRMISVEDIDGPFDLEACAAGVVDLVLARASGGRHYGIICVAEGLADKLPEDKRPNEVDKHGNVILGEAQVGRMLADAVERRHLALSGRKFKVRSKQIGYETRCADPSAFDILLGSQLGVGGYRALAELNLSGHMVSVEKQLQLKFVPFDELVDPETLKTRIRLIERDSDFYRLARALEYYIRKE